MSASPAAPRACGECSLCCRVLRVDALRKLGGVACLHQDVRGPGCAIHASRPAICRRYRCLWLGGAFEERDRPDRLGAVLDLVSRGGAAELWIHEAAPGEYDRNARLRELAARYRAAVPVRIRDAEGALDADRAYRVLLPDGDELVVQGDWTERRRPSGARERRRLPWLERVARRALLAWRRRRLRGYRGADA